jgi:hypothetical protein
MNKGKEYQERLNKLNDGKLNYVYDCIDKPIRKMIYHMNRIGIKTRFSCCGFHYNKEEEPKTHNKVTYVQFFGPKDTTEANIFFNFSQACMRCGWEVSTFAQGLWIARYRHTQLSEYHTDKTGTAIHDYELPVIAIANLEKTLEKFPTYKKKFVIEDGNKAPSKNLPEWQVKAKEDSIFEVDE